MVRKTSVVNDISKLLFEYMFTLCFFNSSAVCKLFRRQKLFGATILRDAEEARVQIELCTGFLVTKNILDFIKIIA